MSPKKLKVATPTLRDLAGEVKTVSAKLDDSPSLLSQHRDDVGCKTTGSALESFEDHWSRGRRKLREKSEAIGSMLTDSADAYEDTDAAAAAAFTRDSQQATVGSR